MGASNWTSESLSSHISDLDKRLKATQRHTKQVWPVIKFIQSTFSNFRNLVSPYKIPHGK